MQRGDARSAGTCEGVDLASLARREGTPLHVYSAAAVRDRLRALHAALAGLDAGVCYAVKANGNGAILRLMAEEGAGADIVSGGELWRALRAGIPRAASSFPAWARPKKKCSWHWPRASSSSMSKASRNWTR